MIDKLKRWLSGDANWKAEQELGQLGKKDPFLADAMEGYRSMPESDHASAVKDLKTKLKAHHTQGKGGKAAKGSAVSWKVFVAAASLIGVVGLFIWTQNSFDSSGGIAETRPTPKSQMPAKGAPIEELEKTFSNEEATDFDQVAEAESEDPEIVEGGASSTVIGNAVEPNPNNRPPVVDPSNIEAGITTEDDLYADDISVTKDKEAEWDIDENANDRIANNSVTEDVIVAAPTPPAYAEPDIADAGAKAKEAKKEANAQTRKYESDPVVASTYSLEMLNLKGKVLDLTSENALIGANVYLKGTGEGVVTDVEGNFSIESTEPLPWVLGISYVGYTDIEITVNDLDDPLQIKLDGSDIALEEVVVTSSKPSKKESRQASTASTASVNEAKPVKGFKKYKRYIRRNLNYPSGAKQNKIQGGVTVRFYINEEGKPTEASVINSLGSGCDTEAIRLIEEGPEWEPKKQWAMYTVVFEL